VGLLYLNKNKNTWFSCFISRWFVVDWGENNIEFGHVIVTSEVITILEEIW